MRVFTTLFVPCLQNLLIRYSFLPSLSFGSLRFGVFVLVLHSMLRGRVGASGMVLSVLTSYIYVRFGGWLAWCLVLALRVCLSWWC